MQTSSHCSLSESPSQLFQTTTHCPVVSTKMGYDSAQGGTTEHVGNIEHIPATEQRLLVLEVGRELLDSRIYDDHGDPHRAALENADAPVKMTVSTWLSVFFYGIYSGRVPLLALQQTQYCCPFHCSETTRQPEQRELDSWRMVSRRKCRLCCCWPDERLLWKKRCLAHRPRTTTRWPHRRRKRSDSEPTDRCPGYNRTGNRNKLCVS